MRLEVDQTGCAANFFPKRKVSMKTTQKQTKATAKKDQATIKISSARQSKPVAGNGVNRSVLTETTNTPTQIKNFIDPKVISN